VVSVVFWTLLDNLGDTNGGGDDAAHAFVIPVDEALADPARLAFDHHQILSDAVARVETELA
jgi:8-oxo-dGTP diphosphatase